MRACVLNEPIGDSDWREILAVAGEGEAERFGAVCVNGATVIELVDERGHAAGVVCEERDSRERKRRPYVRGKNHVARITAGKFAYKQEQRNRPLK